MSGEGWAEGEGDSGKHTRALGGVLRAIGATLSGLDGYVVIIRETGEVAVANAPDGRLGGLPDDAVPDLRQGSNFYGEPSPLIDPRIRAGIEGVFAGGGRFETVLHVGVGGAQVSSLRVTASPLEADGERYVTVQYEPDDETSRLNNIQARSRQVDRRNAVLLSMVGRTFGASTLEERMGALLDEASRYSDFSAVEVWLREEDAPGFKRYCRIQDGQVDTSLRDAESADEFLPSRPEGRNHVFAGQTPDGRHALVAPIGRAGAEVRGFLLGLGARVEAPNAPLAEGPFFAAIAARVLALVEGEETDRRRQVVARGLERLLEDRTRSLQRALAAEQSARERTDALLTALAEPLVVVDERRCVVVANQAAHDALTFASDDLVGRCLDEWIDVSALTRRALKGRRLASAEVTVGERVYDVRVSPVRRGEGEPEHAVLLMHDVSERHQLARLKDDLLATVSHELRTPLTSLRGFA